VPGSAINSKIQRDEIDLMFVLLCSVNVGRYAHVSSMGDVHEHVQVNVTFIL